MCVTGQSAHERTDIVQVDVEQSGVGTSRESFSYLVSLLQATVLPLLMFGSTPTLCLRTLLPPLLSTVSCPAAGGKGRPKCVR